MDPLWDPFDHLWSTPLTTYGPPMDPLWTLYGTPLTLQTLGSFMFNIRLMRVTRVTRMIRLTRVIRVIRDD